MLLAYLYWNCGSAAIARDLTTAIPAKAAAAPAENRRREIVCFMGERPFKDSVKEQPAVDGEHLAVDVGCGGGKKPGDRLGDLEWVGRTSEQRRTFDELSLRLVLQRGLKHRRKDGSGNDSVDGDTALGERPCRVARERENSALARGVGGGSVQSAATFAGDAGDGADASTGLHVFRRFAHAQERPDDVDLVDVQKRRRVEFCERRRVDDAGRRRERVERRSQRLDGALEGARDRTFVGDVAGEGRPADRVGDGMRAQFVPVDDSNAITVACKDLASRLSDTACAAGDDRRAHVAPYPDSFVSQHL